MKFTKITVLTLFLAAALSTAAFAVQFAGESMSIGVGARPLGMGGTFAGIADDASTSYWNPAGMSNIQGVEVSSVKLTKINDLDTRYSYVNLVYNTGAYGAFGLGWLRQAINGITLTTPDGTIIEPSSESADNVIYLAYSYPFAKGFSLGLGAKIMLGNYPALVYPAGYVAGDTGVSNKPVSYSGGGVDLGVFFAAGEFVKELKGFQIGLNIQDIYTGYKWDPIAGIANSGTSEKVDVNIKPGLAWKIGVGQFEITPAVDMDTKYQLIVHGGLEVWWNKMIGLRGGVKYWGALTDAAAAGITTPQTPDISFGASLRWYFIGIDYAFVNNELTPVQYLSIIGKF